jgi:hypothetical protein
MSARRTLAGCLVAGAALVGACAAVSAHADSHVLSADYSGSLIYRSASTSHVGTLTLSRALSWDMTIYDDGHTVRKTLAADGSSGEWTTGGGGASCTVSQRTSSIEGSGFMIGLGNLPGRVNVATFIPNDVGPKGDLMVSGGFCDGLQGDGGVIFSTVNADGSLASGYDCYGFAAARQFVTPRVDRNLKPDAIRHFDKAQSVFRAKNCQTQSDADVTETRSIHATLRVGAGTTSDPEREGPTPSERQKVFAVSDLLTSLIRAQGPCGYVYFGVVATIWATTVPGAVASAALVPAEVLISAGVPLCVTYGKRIFDDITIANDPPAGNINTIAQPKPTPSSAAAAANLASCAPLPADQQAFCAELRADTADDIAAAQKVTAIADALLQTVDRETKARETHKASALKRQSSAGNRLMSQMQAADLAEKTANQKIATLLMAHGVSGQLTTAQDGAAITAMLKQINTDGASPAAVKRLAPVALVASPVGLFGTYGG